MQSVDTPPLNNTVHETASPPTSEAPNRHGAPLPIYDSTMFEQLHSYQHNSRAEFHSNARRSSHSGTTTDNSFPFGGGIGERYACKQSRNEICGEEAPAGTETIRMNEHIPQVWRKFVADESVKMSREELSIILADVERNRSISEQKNAAKRTRLELLARNDENESDKPKKVPKIVEVAAEGVLSAKERPKARTGSGLSRRNILQPMIRFDESAEKDDQFAVTPLALEASSPESGQNFIDSQQYQVPQDLSHIRRPQNFQNTAPSPPLKQFQAMNYNSFPYTRRPNPAESWRHSAHLRSKANAVTKFHQRLCAQQRGPLGPRMINSCLDPTLLTPASFAQTYLNDSGILPVICKQFAQQHAITQANLFSTGQQFSNMQSLLPPNFRNTYGISTESVHPSFPFSNLLIMGGTNAAEFSHSCSHLSKPGSVFDLDVKLSIDKTYTDACAKALVNWRVQHFLQQQTQQQQQREQMLAKLESILGNDMQSLGTTTANANQVITSSEGRRTGRE